MQLYNSLSRKVEEFKPINPPHVGMYTCGPTVYSYPTIGNYRTYVTSDLLLRTLKFLGYETKYVMNLTDVGHLTGDNSGDADTGEDRLEKASKKENKTAWDIAKFYGDDFVNSLSKLNIEKPDIIAKATDHIDDQIKLIEVLEKKKLTYKISDGIYFDTVAFEKQTGEKYGEMSNLDQIKEGARVEPNPQKKNPRDFALWKFSPKDEKRQMEWESPWGTGFPGWHIECSAMSMKYLGEQFDIHAGGEDLRSTHHPNEIAQSEGATGKIPFVKYWVHGAFLTVDGGRMGKSLGNAYTLHDVEEKGFDDLDLRYFYFTGHYRKQLNFTWEALSAAQAALNKLKLQVQNLRSQEERNSLSEEKLSKVDAYRKEFTDAISDDLNMPQALAVVWEVLKSNIPSEDKYDLIMDFDEVLGLELNKEVTQKEIPQEIKDLMQKREELRKSGNYEEADKIRDEIIQKGYTVNDDKSS
ncbi:MAG TPA: cysteine--tRNA ligase [Patescibacteria group bacterium]|nr:cysteine--tRNA ligase [Patescibacteria group bacterium]